MVDAVRSLTLGSQSHDVLGHPASYFVVRSLLWTGAILAVSVPLAIARYRRGWIDAGFPARTRGCL